MNMACVKFGLTPEEAWAGVTRHAARALGRQNSHGQLAAGFVANLPSGMPSIRSRWCMSRGAVRSGSVWYEENDNDAVASYPR